MEAATQTALREFGPAVLAAGKHLMVLSVGALIGVLDEWVRLAEKHGCRILVPSGAIAGLDGVKGAREGAITSVTMETRKPPRGLAGAPYIEERGIDLDAIREETLIFEGPATRGGEGLPRQRQRGGRPVAGRGGTGADPDQALRGSGPAAQPAPDHGGGRVRAARHRGGEHPLRESADGKLSYLSAIAMLRELGAPVRVG